MATSAAAAGELVARIEKLERQNRRLLKGAAAALLAAGSLVLMAQAKGGGAPKTVQAQVFEVVDKTGTVVARLDGRGGPELVRFDILDGTGKDRLSLVATADGSLVRLADAGGSTASLLVSSTGPSPALSLENPARKAQVAIGLSAKGAVLTLSDQGQPGAVLVSGPQRRGIALYDDAGKLAWSAPQ